MQPDLAIDISSIIIFGCIFLHLATFGYIGSHVRHIRPYLATCWLPLNIQLYSVYIAATMYDQVFWDPLHKFLSLVESKLYKN